MVLPLLAPAQLPAVAQTEPEAEPAGLALPFAPDCRSMQAHFNRVGKAWQPPVQVAALGTWIADAGYVACGSGVVVRYQGTTTLVCPLTGESRQPYTALEYIPGREEFRVRTDRCEVVPTLPLQAPVASNPAPKPPRPWPLSCWPAPLLAALLMSDLPDPVPPGPSDGQP